MICELTMRQKEIYEFHHKHDAEGAMMEYSFQAGSHRQLPITAFRYVYSNFYFRT